METTNDFAKLEDALFRLGREIEYPPTPAIAARVRSELGRTTQAPIVAPWRLSLNPRVFIAVAVAIFLALVLLFAFPDAREAVAQFLGLRGLRIFYVTPTPTAQPTFTPRPGITPSETPRATPTRTPTFIPFSLCCETTLADAQQRARFKLLLPQNDQPTKVYYQRVYDNGEQVVMVFGDPQNPRFTLYQAQRWVYGKIVDSGVFGKGMQPQTKIGEARVNGNRALWFSGAPHVVMVLDEHGEPIYSTEQTVNANTLVWETGDPDFGIIYRLETKLSLDEAVRIAESLR